MESAGNIAEYWRFIRDRDAYVAYAVLPDRPSFGVRVVREDHDGAVISRREGAGHRRGGGRRGLDREPPADRRDSSDGADHLRRAVQE
jgi:hypothetical protein